MNIDPGMIRRLQQDLHGRIDKMRDDLKNRTVEGTAGGGVVKVVCNGNGEVSSVKIGADAIDPSDPEMLQDLIMAATNQALQKAKKLEEDTVGDITGGMKLPGFF